MTDISASFTPFAAGPNDIALIGTPDGKLTWMPALDVPPMGSAKKQYATLAFANGALVSDKEKFAAHVGETVRNLRAMMHRSPASREEYKIFDPVLDHMEASGYQHEEALAALERAKKYPPISDQTITQLTEQLKIEAAHIPDLQFLLENTESAIFMAKTLSDVAIPRFSANPPPLSIQYDAGLDQAALLLPESTIQKAAAGQRINVVQGILMTLGYVSHWDPSKYQNTAALKNANRELRNYYGDERWKKIFQGRQESTVQEAVTFIHMMAHEKNFSRARLQKDFKHGLEIYDSLMATVKKKAEELRAQEVTAGMGHDARAPEPAPAIAATEQSTTAAAAGANQGTGSETAADASAPSREFAIVPQDPASEADRRVAKAFEERFTSVVPPALQEYFKLKGTRFEIGEDEFHQFRASREKNTVKFTLRNGTLNSPLMFACQVAKCAFQTALALEEKPDTVNFGALKEMQDIISSGKLNSNTAAWEAISHPKEDRNANYLFSIHARLTPALQKLAQYPDNIESSLKQQAPNAVQAYEDYLDHFEQRVRLMERMRDDEAAEAQPSPDEPASPAPRIRYLGQRQHGASAFIETPEERAFFEEALALVPADIRAALEAKNVAFQTVDSSAVTTRFAEDGSICLGSRQRYRSADVLAADIIGYGLTSIVPSASIPENIRKDGVEEAWLAAEVYRAERALPKHDMNDYTPRIQTGYALQSAWFHRDEQPPLEQANALLAAYRAKAAEMVKEEQEAARKGETAGTQELGEKIDSIIPLYVTPTAKKSFGDREKALFEENYLAIPKKYRELIEANGVKFYFIGKYGADTKVRKMLTGEKILPISVEIFSPDFAKKYKGSDGKEYRTALQHTFTYGGLLAAIGKGDDTVAWQAGFKDITQLMGSDPATAQWYIKRYLPDGSIRNHANLLCDYDLAGARFSTGKLNKLKNKQQAVFKLSESYLAFADAEHEKLQRQQRAKMAEKYQATDTEFAINRESLTAPQQAYVEGLNGIVKELGVTTGELDGDFRIRLADQVFSLTAEIGKKLMLMQQNDF